jgi:CHAT domain-containing protein
VNGSRYAVRWALASALAATLSGSGAASALAAEPSAAPYVLDHGPLDFAQRVARHRDLAASAASAGDTALQARHAALACFWHSMLTVDADFTAPSCHDAQRLAKGGGLLDVELALDHARGMVAVLRLDYQRAYGLFAGIVARGATMGAEASGGGHAVRGARLMLGILLTETGRYGNAAALFEALRVDSRQAGDLEDLGHAELWDCWNELQEGDLGRARAACDRTAALLASSNDFWLDINLAFIEGELLAQEGDAEGALVRYRHALDLSARPGGGLRAPTIRSVIASQLITLHRYDEARAHLEGIDRDVAAGRFPQAWVPLVEHQWGKLERAAHDPGESARHFAASSQSPEQHIQIWGLRGLAEARRQLGDLAGARVALEEAIRRVESARTSVAGSAARAAYAETHASIYRDLVGVRWDLEGAGASAGALDLAEAGKARALLDALVQAQVVGAAAPTLASAAVQARLAPDEVLVEYVSAEDRLFAITVTRDRIVLRPLPGAGTAEELERRVRFFAALVQENDEATITPAARRLHADLLAPALAGIAPAVRTLIVAADGPLHRLPFDALGDATRVIDRWDVVTLPSASALATRAVHAPTVAAALVVAAPAGADGLGTLPAAPAEAAALRRRIGGEVAELSGADATQARLEALGLGRYAVLHFASHALVDEARPLRSALILAPAAAGGDGKWSAEEIYKAKLGADLVVLSACGTAGGAETSGEGVMSLSRAFLHAGAGSTIATLWDVLDAPGPVFADVLYRNLGAGRPLSVAAAAARRELRRGGAPPRAWAAYTVTGNPGSRVGVTGRVDPWTVAARIAGGLAALVLLAAVATRLAQLGVRIPMPAAALVSAGLAVVAFTLPTWPNPSPRWDSAVRSGAGLERLTAAIDAGRVIWSPLAAADEHFVEVYDEAGLPVGPPKAAASPFILPAAPGGGWIRIEARRRGRPIARSALISLARPVP